jgi:hypothetical protein
VLSGMSFAFNIEYPPAFTELTNELKVLQVDFAGVLPFGCIGKYTFHQQFQVQTLGPPVIFFIMWIIHKIRKGKLPEQVDPPDNQIQMLHDDLKASSLNMVFTFLFLIYPVTSQTIFQTFMSHQIDDDEILLRADFQVDYTTTEHIGYIVQGGLMVLIYPLGFPLAIFLVLWSNRAELQKEDSAARVAYDPIVEPYRLECYYWEALEMFRKILLTGLMIFWSPGSVQQLVTGVQISAMFFVLSVKNRPFVTRFNNNFKICTDLAVLITFAVAILLSPRVDQSMEPAWVTRDVMDTILLVANMFIPALVVFMEFSRGAEQEEEDIHARYGWLGDERDGGFKLLVEEEPRLAGLRRELEALELKTLNSGAREAGLTQEELEEVHNTDHPKQVLIDHLMEHAAKESDRKAEQVAKGAKKIGTVRRVYGIEQKEKKQAKRAEKKKEMLKTKEVEQEFNNPVSDEIIPADEDPVDEDGVVRADAYDDDDVLPADDGLDEEEEENPLATDAV